MDDIHTKYLFLESFSREESIQFTNVEEVIETGGRNENTKEVLRTFLGRDLCYMEARSVEIQRVHRIGKNRVPFWSLS